MENAGEHQNTLFADSLAQMSATASHSDLVPMNQVSHTFGADGPSVLHISASCHKGDSACLWVHVRGFLSQEV